MKIGIDASRAFFENRTGIEEYSYQIIREIIKENKDNKIILYLRKNQSKKLAEKDFTEFCANEKIEIREISFHRFWTQIGLAVELLIDPIDILFVPAHTVPWIHPKKTLVTIHGLEYEHFPEGYSFYSRLLHRFFIKKSCLWTDKILAVSKKTKADLVRLYKAPKEKIRVIYNGFSKKEADLGVKKGEYLIFVGRLEKRKNIEGIVRAFEILKEKYGYGGKLLLVGRPGYGYEEIKEMIKKSHWKNEIDQRGFVEDDEKNQLIQNAQIFFFPSISEGFGIPILEAQSMGTPVITSNYGPMDEVSGDENILVDPNDHQAMAKLANKMLGDSLFRKKIIEDGLENVKKFSWKKSAKETFQYLTS